MRDSGAARATPAPRRSSEKKSYTGTGYRGRRARAVALNRTARERYQLSEKSELQVIEKITWS